jgi:hypothetical protein
MMPQSAVEDVRERADDAALVRGTTSMHRHQLKAIPR